MYIPNFALPVAYPWAREIGGNLLNQICCGEHNGGRAGHDDASRVNARSCKQLGVHAGRIGDQLLWNIHPSPSVDGPSNRRVDKVNCKGYDTPCRRTTPRIFSVTRTVSTEPSSMTGFFFNRDRDSNIL